MTIHVQVPLPPGKSLRGVICLCGRSLCKSRKSHAYEEYIILERLFVLIKFLKGLAIMRGHLHHIEIYVSQLRRSREFWDFLLTQWGYTIYQEWADGISWKLDDTYLVLVQVQEKHLLPSYHRSKVGLNHLAFHAGSRQEVDQLTKQLSRMNVPILYPDKHPYAGGPDHYAVYFEDPDRMKIEVAAPLKVRDGKG